MADRFEAFDVTVTAGTPRATPVATDISFPPGEVVGLEVVIPDGANGLAGWALAQAHQAVIPRTPGAFIVGNDETVKWDSHNTINNGNWQLVCFNTDVFDHTFSVRFLVNELRAPLPGAASSQPLTSIDAGAGAGVDAGAGVPIDDGTGDLPAGDGTLPPIGPDDGGDGLPPDVPLPDDSTGDLPDLSGLPADDVPPVDAGVPDVPLPDDQTGSADPGRGALVAPVAGGTKRQPTTHRPAKAPAKRAPAAPREIVTHETLPAGGWLPHGARFTLRRIDQGQDFITGWRGPIIAPGDGECVQVGHDQPFPSGFGPAYPWVRIDTGRWAGHTYYIGHCTSAVRQGQRFKAGQVLAHADQGHTEGGGWCELGLTSAIGHGIHGQGNAIAHLFGPVTITHRKAAPSHLVATSGRGSGSIPAAKRKPAAHPPAAKAPTVKRSAVPAHGAASVPGAKAATHKPAAGPSRKLAPPVSRPAAPAPRKPAPPPPPPPKRAAAPAPAKRRR